MGIFTRNETRKQEFSLATFLQSELFSSLAKGISVNKQSALSIPAFSNGVQVIAQLLASFPLYMYKVEGQDRLKTPYHYLQKVINVRPNSYMSSFDFWELIVQDMICNGNAYARIERGGKYNDIIGLHPLTAEYVSKEWNDKTNSFIFKYNRGDSVFIYKQNEIWHLQNFGDGIKGYSIIEQFKNVIEQALVIEKFTTTFFKQGPNSHLILETPDGVPAPKMTSIEAFKSFWKKANKFEDKHTPTVVPGGLKVKELAHLNLKDSSLIELKTHVIQEIARILKLPPHIIADLSKSSFNNIQEQNRNILTIGINPYIKRIENSINVFLLHEYEIGKYFCEFKKDAFIEANPLEKSQEVSNLVSSGVMTINQAKERYNLPNIQFGDDTYAFNQLTSLELINKGQNLSTSTDKKEVKNEKE